MLNVVEFGSQISLPASEKSEIDFKCLSTLKIADSWIAYKMEKLYYLVGLMHLEVSALT